ncbi:hypothetical protein OH687_28715 [Burkholderia anthina]|nr:hypothetical protein OH687_28715 [Burkholderia anthina]
MPVRRRKEVDDEPFVVCAPHAVCRQCATGKWVAADRDDEVAATRTVSDAW